MTCRVESDRGRIALSNMIATFFSSFSDPPARFAWKHIKKAIGNATRRNYTLRLAQYLQGCCGAVSCTLDLKACDEFRIMSFRQVYFAPVSHNGK